MLKLKLPYFGQLMRRSNSVEKALMLGKSDSKRRRGLQRMRWLDRMTNSMNMNLSKHWEIVKNREVWCAGVHGVTESQMQLTSWTTTKCIIIIEAKHKYKLLIIFLKIKDLKSVSRLRFISNYHFRYSYVKIMDFNMICISFLLIYQVLYWPFNM